MLGECTVYIVQYTVHIIRWVHCVYCTVHSVHCTVYIVRWVYTRCCGQSAKILKEHLQSVKVSFSNDKVCQSVFTNSALWAELI